MYKNINHCILILLCFKGGWNLNISKESLQKDKDVSRIYFLIIFLISTYVIDNSDFRNIIGNQTYNYIFKPIIWIFVSIYLFKIENIRFKSKLKNEKFILEWSVIFSIVFISIGMFTGFIFGFARNPYGRSISAIIINIIYFFTELLGQELIRNRLINKFVKKEEFKVFLIISFFYSLLSFKFNVYMSLDSIEVIIQFVASEFLPELISNLFATYVCFLAGFKASILYLGIITLFNYTSPILPNTPWIINSLTGILLPIFFLISMQNMYLKKTKQIKMKMEKEESIVGWIITSLISICIIWFTVGVFSIYPSVIVTGSMEPIIKPGDVIIVDKIMDENEIYDLKENEIIQFKKNDILICHRIIRITEDDSGNILFKTKGDNNSVEDPYFITVDMIKGKVIKIIPKIGLPTMLLKTNKAIDLEYIEF